jgi:inhibitor of cysteine peptidase
MPCRRFAIIAAMALLWLVAGCTMSDSLRLTERDNGSTVTVKPGTEFEAVVATNPSTGYTWVWPGGEAANKVVEPVGTPRFDRDAEEAIRVGSGGNETWRFRAVRPGRETVRLEYRRAWDSATPPERTFTFTAEVLP